MHAERHLPVLIQSAGMIDSPLLKRLLWSGLVAGFSALASIAAARVAAIVWKRAFGEEPPE
jgi:hypothetical protein